MVGYVYLRGLNLSFQKTDDWYTLVTQVTTGGPAEGKLMVGDWIRSINGEALVNPSEVCSQTRAHAGIKFSFQLFCFAQTKMTYFNFTKNKVKAQSC